MIQLSREIRFALVPPANVDDGASKNSWAAWPSTNLVVPHLSLRCVVAGEPDARSGYLCNIKLIDKMLRGIVINQLLPQFEERQPGKHQLGKRQLDQPGDTLTGEAIIRTVFDQSALSVEQGTLGEAANLVALTLEFSPFLEFTITAKEPEMVQLTQQFEFSAAHRLNCEELSSEENRQLFGKCNNPAGHGHNYVIEVTVGREVASDENSVIDIHRMESTVKRLVIDPLDHKHLNEDVDYFKDVNPTVENIAIAIHGWLDGKFDSARLQKVRVFETPKTWAEYAGPKS
jgi:6-pyruvoyltetrahydropterin/6-carboxytetrahydropterin synthase